MRSGTRPGPDKHKNKDLPLSLRDLSRRWTPDPERRLGSYAADPAAELPNEHRASDGITIRLNALLACPPTPGRAPAFSVSVRAFAE
eukprot:scaffold19428_cov101-Isochrysis_galbana.AAC.1